MHIKEVVIDGFKSYATRTVISRWDPKFNAITGLNGTGKSNILDSICFVLGISNLSQVRVQSLKQLVYKQGQSGVQKASVSIVFDNADPTQSPQGYEDVKEFTITRQVAIQGRNKYLINGRVVQRDRVKDLFHSVQLNVNNPHFLIMQGRITKVCNMKPPEILAMIEEAAGTRMFENKKVAAQKTIAKKQARVDEINSIIDEEIAGKIEKLLKERSLFYEHTANKTEIERLVRYLVAHEFLKVARAANSANGDVDGMRDTRDQLDERIADVREQIKAVAARIKAAVADKRAHDTNGKLKQVEEIATKRSKELVKTTTEWKHSETKVADLNKEHLALTQRQAAARTSMEANRAEASGMQEHVAALEAEHAKGQQELEALQGAILGIGAADDEGKDSDKKQTGTLSNQLMQMQKQATESESAMQEAAMLIKSKQQELAKEEKALGKGRREHDKMRKMVDAKTEALDAIQQKIDAHGGYDETRKVAVETDMGEAQERVRTLGERKADLEASVGSMRALNFVYKAPSARFDKSRVKGVLANLIRVKDPRMARAVQVAGGGALYHVVVDTEQTGKELMQKGKLQRRVTMIPLNKVSTRGVSAEALRRAQNLVGADKCCLASSLVDYDKEVANAVSFAFGSSFVCADAHTAEKVAFNPKIRVRCVTVDGDVYDPAGTLTGGSSGTHACVLAELAELATVKDELEALQASVETLGREYAVLVKASDAVESLLAQKSKLEREATAATKHLAMSEFVQHETECHRLEAELDEHTSAQAEAKLRLSEATEQCARLEKSIRDFEKERVAKTKEIEQAIATGRKDCKRMLDAMKKKQQQQQTLLLEAEAAQTDLAAAEEQLATLDEEIVAAQAAMLELEATVATCQEAYDTAAKAVAAEMKVMEQSDKVLAEMSAERDRLSKDMSESELEKKKIVHRIQRLEGEQTDAKRREETMLNKHDWIRAERDLFGVQGSAYDFASMPAKKAEKRLADLRAKQTELGKRVNKKVMGMFESVEQEYHDLVKKRDIILRDKQKIEQVIGELDRKKMDALETTWKKVTSDFGSIFSTLLPGSTAKLASANGSNVTDGLEMRVAFGGVWKESLTELSGGQRSLLALSLILALLRFKPAPMYILDEIDAALDLSHTQNIGAMLKTHFPQSQFIVVSLKEGMFNNANVLFRTRFVDGVSAVTRTMHGKKATAGKPAKAKTGRKRKAGTMVEAR